MSGEADERAATRGPMRVSTAPVDGPPTFQEPTAVVKVALRPLSHATTPVLTVMSGQHIGLMVTVSDAPMVIGRDATCEMALSDAGVSRKHCRIWARGTEVTLEDLGSTNGTFVNRHAVTQCVLANGDQIQLGRATILKFSLQDEEEQAFQRGLYNASVRDHLTGTFNKRYFMDRLKSEHAFCVRHRLPLSLLMIDIDHFKRVNDTWGHSVGDSVLRQLAGAVTRTIRSDDVFARFGGEEFAVIARNLSAMQAHAFAERLRLLMERTPFEGVADGRVTISLGCATLVPDGASPPPEELLEAADQQLYAAKRGGRNRVMPELAG